MSERLTFQEILENHTVAELKDIIKEAGMKGYSKMKKDEMIAHISALALDENFAEKKFLYASDSEIEIMIKASSENVTIDSESMEYYYWENLCFAFIDQDYEVDIPAEVMKLYNKISKKDSYQKQRKRIYELVQYGMATANLYGAIELSKLTEIINGQTELNVTVQELTEVYGWREVLRGCEIFCCQNGYITDEIYGENILGIKEDYKKLLAQQGNKPYYIPEREELLKYSDTIYVEKNNVFEAMLAFMKKDMELNEELAKEICNELQLQIRNGAVTQQIFDELERKNVIFPDDEAIKNFSQRLIDMYNNTRLRENRGYTPVEIETNIPGNSVYSEETYEQVRNLGSISQQIEHQSKVIPLKRGEKKIYPNDPCPCGSGKKYKKCCGRNK